MTTAAPHDRRVVHVAGTAGLTAAHLAVAHPEWMARMVKVDTVDGPVPMDLWAHQVDILRAVLAFPRVMVLKARQLGVSWTLALLALWWALAKPGQTVLVVSIGEREAASLMRKVRRLYDSLPAVVRAAYPLASDTVTRVEIAHPEGASAILSLPSSSTAGRGETVDLLLGDERPKWPHAAEQEASLFPAAADSGRIVLVGTANGMDGFYERWIGDDAWHKIFVGATSRPGRTREWVDVERRALGSLGPQEYPLTAAEAFLASGRCVFDQDGLQDLLDHSTRPPEARVDLRHTGAGIVAEAHVEGAWRVWEWPQAGHDYLVTADVCGGQGGEDYAAAAIYDVASWDQVAAFHGRPEPHIFEAELVKAGWLYAGKDSPALVAPESNNHGQAVVALLREHRYPRIYSAQVWDQRTQQHTTRLGWATTPKSRPQLVSALQEAVRTGSLGIRDAAAVGEMFRFVDSGNGKPEADAGAHDDRVIAHGIAAVLLSRTGAAKPKPRRRKSTPYVPRVSARTGY